MILLQEEENRSNTTMPNNPKHKSDIDQLYEILLLNCTRLKSLTWTEVYSLFGKTPTYFFSQIFDHKRTNTQDLIDPMWILTQSYKNYGYTDSDSPQIDTVIKNYSHTSMFMPIPSEVGISTPYVNRYASPYCFPFASTSDWYVKQLFCISYFKTYSHLKDIDTIRLISSTSMRVSTQRSDIDVIIKTKPNKVYSVRFFVKFIFLKLNGRDVHKLSSEILLKLIRLYYSIFFHTNSLGNSKADWIIRHNLEKRKTKSNKYLIDCGIFYSDFKSIVEHYGRDIRQRLWLYENSLLPSNYSSFIQAIKNKETHILYLHEYKLYKNNILQTHLKPLILQLLYFICSPVSHLQSIYYKNKQKNEENYVINNTIIGFIPRIYKQGYFEKIKKRRLTKIKR